MDNSKFDFFQELAEHIEQVVFAYEINSNQFLYLSPAFEELWQQSRESITSPFDLFANVHPEDKNYLQKNYRELLNGSVKKDIEFRIIISGETEKWICITSLLLQKKKEGEDVIIGYAEDITSKKEHDDTLSKFANKKNSILNIISHDLFGPLGSIKALSSILAKKTIRYEDKDLNKLIGLIDKLSTQSINLIKDFVKQEFLESVKVDLVKERVDLVAKIREVIEMYQELEPEINKTFKLSSSNEEIFLKIDVTKFIQVINNLLSNSLKFTHEGAVIIVEIEENKDTILMKVKDNGIGIPQKYHANLFEKFTAARRSGLKGEPSVGLGMSIIKTIIDWHQGKIWFESEENKGTTFYIELPKN